MVTSLILAALLAGTPGAAPKAKPSAAAPRSMVESARQAYVVVTTELFWRAVVRNREIVLEGMGHPERRLKIERRSGEGGARRWHARDGDSQVTVSITPGECSDGMSDVAYSMSATLDIGGTVAKGCATRQPDAR